MQNKKLKILFFIPTPFGIRGTTGTYRLIEVLASMHDVLVIAPDRPAQEKYVIHQNNDLQLVKIRNRTSFDSIFRIKQIISRFHPDIIYLFNSPSSLAYLFSLHHLFPDIKWLADFRTPLLQEGAKRREIRRATFLLQFYVDVIITLSRHSVKTWIPFLIKKTQKIPIGIDVTNFNPKNHLNGITYCRKFVFIGSFHRFRKLDRLISYFHHTVLKNKTLGLTLDIYGAGPAENELRELIAKLQVGNSIYLRGLLDQDKLLPKLSDYDAGIAYVPYEKYDKSPSLKSIEYAAAGIHVLASDTTAHQSQMRDHELFFHLFANDQGSFISAVTKCAVYGIDKKQLTFNLENVRCCDYHSIVKHHISPLLQDLANGR